ncbi:hypothetical protein RSO01_49570 [Reyranella soli]|uniref:Uncharacterized protein n=1 Tax=Reyranella soli TaxID=1230389 RepID=A0A512NFQ6_9HYPH|nr:hypothetical protein RSO01_49570 [Reyranella soli]
MRLIASLLACSIVCGALPSIAIAEPLTPVRFQQVLATAKAYAADRTLIFYCIRDEPGMLPFNYLVVHTETEAALNKLKAAGSEAKQNAELVEAVMANVRYPTTGASDAAMDAECQSKNVRQSYFTFSGPLITPLDRRPPFDSLK